MEASASQASTYLQTGQADEIDIVEGYSGLFPTLELSQLQVHSSGTSKQLSSHLVPLS